MAHVAIEADAIANQERVYQLEQRAQSFRIRRDRYLEPLQGYQSLAVHTTMGNQPILRHSRMEDYLGFGSPAEDILVVYGPKNGDYRNLQRFSSSLVRFADDDAGNQFRLCLFLALPQGSLALLSWLKDQSFLSEDVVLTVNGATYPFAFPKMGVQSLDEIVTPSSFHRVTNSRSMEQTWMCFFRS